MEKSFIDLYLLGDTKEILEYISAPGRAASLNSLEKGAAGRRNSLGTRNQDAAATILRSMKNDVAGVKRAVGEQSRVFDTILSMNVMEEKNGTTTDHI